MAQMQIPDDTVFWGETTMPFNLATWARHPFTADSDPRFFRLLQEKWGEDAVHAFALAVAPYVGRGHIGVPRISLQLFSDDDWPAPNMRIQGEEVGVWPFRVAAAPGTEKHGVWEQGQVHFLQDVSLWQAVKGAQFLIQFRFQD